MWFCREQSFPSPGAPVWRNRSLASSIVARFACRGVVNGRVAGIDMNFSGDIMYCPSVNFASCISFPCTVAVISFAVRVIFPKHFVASCADIKFEMKFGA